jgi:hypothetical protein
LRSHFIAAPGKDPEIPSNATDGAEIILLAGRLHSEHVVCLSSKEQKRSVMCPPQHLNSYILFIFSLFVQKLLIRVRN